MKPNLNPTLWERIEAFLIDDPSAPFNFSRKLAKEQAWTPAFTARAIAEYKRFIFLCCVSPTGASPSPVVDEVWHLHLTYTENYWKRFCAETLGREIHHHPSKGGATENDKHKSWYADTHSLYREVFNEEPPADIWPPAFASTVSPSEATSPKTWQLYRKNLHWLLIPFVLPPLLGKLHPYALTGPQFLLFYALLLVATAVTLYRTRKQKKQWVENAVADADTGDANAFQMARYVYGKHKAVETAVVDLVSKGILIAERGGKLEFYPQKISAEDKSENPLAAGLAAAYPEGGWLKMKDLETVYESDVTYHHGLQELHQRVVKKDWSRFVLLIAVLLIGFFRVRQGISNHRPVSHLEIMMMVGGFLLFIFAMALSSQELLKQVFNRRYEERQLAFAPEQNAVAQFLFLGIATLAGSYAFANLESTFKRHAPASGGDGGISSGCGSSGCGSGCGGGGCGGCGGGD